MRITTLLLSLALAAITACPADEKGPDPTGDTLADAAGDVSEGDAPVADTSSDIGEPDVPPLPPPDRDEDGVPDDEDLFPDDPCEARDMDGDGVGDAADPDRDGDGVDDRWERRVGTDPNDPNDTPPETDSDSDGVPDYRDPFPEDGTRSEDFDGDGLADDEDDDDDNDGVPDDEELAAGDDPYTAVAADLCALDHASGWYPGDFHSHTSYSDSPEDIATWVAVNEYYEDPRFLAQHPEYQGRQLRFQAITDHRTVMGAFDPDFHSDRLVLVLGQEIGGPEHGNGFDLLTYIDHNKRPGESYADRMASAIAQVHWQGATMQANHPCGPGMMWTTPSDELDALEVWNAPWAVQRAVNLTEVDEEIAEKGEANPYIRLAVERETTNANMQALVMWELMLTAGQEIAPVGGSDRHMLLSPGSPTTYVRARQLAVHDVMDGVRARRTIITRHPGAVRLEVGMVEALEERYPGDVVTVSEGANVQIRTALEHAQGCTVQVVAGPVLADPSPEALAAAPAPELLAVHLVPTDAPDPYEWHATVVPPVPGWMYLRVLEPLSLEGLSPETVTTLEEAIEAVKVGVDDPVDLGPLLIPLLAHVDVLGMEPCTEETWANDDELPVECFLVDQDAPYTFLLPEVLSKILNYWSGPGPDTNHALGALTSAFLLRPAQ